ncbi:hypothetical protein EDC96DRAFT_506172 [Choanephora cucurbitarum]|nr:hypothetical protein EDC96DRAFT_506172 [Choanephora cucurbitarum]
MSEEQKIKAEQLFKDGKAAFNKDEFESSVSMLGEACQLMDQINGDLSPKNGDAYFLYGQALLQYAIMQNTVLGQSAQASAKVVEQQQKDEQEQAKSSNPLFQLNDAPEFTSKDEKSKTNDPTEEDEEDDEEDDNDVAGSADEDFEAAWDILDVARVIFEKGEDKETKLKLADVHICLGDISLETEKFNEALSDYEKAIEIKKSVLEETDRELAEAHYKYALALEFSTDKADQAVPELLKAVAVLEKRKEKLDSGKGKQKASETDNDEVKEMDELIADMRLKVEELTQRQASEKEAEAMLKAMLGYGKESTSDAPAKQISASTPVNDLTMLVKRKATEEPKQNTTEKKQKLD